MNEQCDMESNRATWPAALLSLRRTGWRPVTEPGNASARVSKFGGSPLLYHDEPWPFCSVCGKQQELFLQLDARELPEPVASPFGPGVLQVFFCTNEPRRCAAAAESHDAFSRGARVRVFDASEQGVVRCVRSSLFHSCPERAIVGWQALADFPDAEEAELAGVHLPDALANAVHTADFPRPGDKLLGWPHWVQGVRYPRCLMCGTLMEHVFQLDSEHNLPHSFGDYGTAHITRCPKHRTLLTLAWAGC